MKKVIAQEVSIMLRYTQYMGNEYRLVKYKGEYIENQEFLSTKTENQEISGNLLL